MRLCVVAALSAGMLWAADAQIEEEQRVGDEAKRQRYNLCERYQRHLERRDELCGQAQLSEYGHARSDDYGRQAEL